MELHDAYDKTADDYVKTQNLFIAKQVKQLADNFLTYECHPGPFFAERRRVCVAIKLMIREGKNVRYEQSRFITIENEAARNLTEKAKQDILDLESKMNMDSKI
jgi:hypothetical protein